MALSLSLVYVLALYLLFTSWFYILGKNAAGWVVNFRAGAYVYAVSNIAKYLPGNVFHFVGRQVLGKRLGWTHGAIARATLLEISALVVGACVVVLVVSLSASGGEAARRLFGDESWLVTHRCGVVVALLMVVVVLLVVLSRMKLAERLFGVPSKTLLVVLGLVIGFFVISSLIAIVFVWGLPMASATAPWAMLVIAYLLAWLAGFVVPGAPGGLGVRESVLVVLLSMDSGDSERIALLLGLGMRFVSTAGDALFAGLAYLFGRGVFAPVTTAPD